MTDAQPSPFAAACPSDEFLLAALTTDLIDDAQRDIDAHLDRCDRCLDTVTLLHRRLALQHEVPHAVPAAVIEGATAALGYATAQPAARPARAAAVGFGARLADLGERLFGNLRWPALVPVAAAAVLALAISQSSWLVPQAPRELSRSVAGHQQLRITAREAPIRSQPSGRADVVATVTRGMVLDVAGEERDWYQVQLPNGTGGWVDRHAFE